MPPPEPDDPALLEAPRLSWATLSQRICALLYDRDQEWAGIPIPLPRLTLTIEPSHPWRARLLEMQAALDMPVPDPDPDLEPVVGGRIRNTWYSRRLGVTVQIYEVNGRVAYTYGSRHDYNERFHLLFNTMQAAAAWNVETELTAMDRLQELIRPHLWNAYVLTGAFVETSTRSGVTYIFRRCRPTIAISHRRVLCTLCLHPIGYYEASHAGSLCPTDDVIAALLLCRADEPYFWKKSNQHAPYRPESGL
jgi:hypothetical protein